MATQEQVEVESVVTVKYANQPKLFGKWDYEEVKVTDPCFKDYVAVHTSRTQVIVPHTAGRFR